MEKFVAKIGFSVDVETKPGIWKKDVEERLYKGYFVRNYRRWDQEPAINQTLTLNNQASFIIDDFCLKHLGDILYVKYDKVPWKVTALELRHPRILVTLGGIYNDEA